MIPARSLLLVLALAAPLAAAQPADLQLPKLHVALYPGLVGFHLEQTQTPFVGIVLGSLSSDLQHYLTGLPPLLDQAVVLAAGVDTEGTYNVRFPDVVFPAGIMVYAQGVTLSDLGIQATGVESFVLDASGGGGTK